MIKWPLTRYVSPAYYHYTGRSRTYIKGGKGYSYVRYVNIKGDTNSIKIVVRNSRKVIFLALTVLMSSSI